MGRISNRSIWQVTAVTILLTSMSYVLAYSPNLGYRYHDPSAIHRRNYPRFRHHHRHRHRLCPIPSLPYKRPGLHLRTIAASVTTLFGGKDDDIDIEINGLATIGSDVSQLVPKQYPYRWVQLGYLSVLALISDWICFSVAATPNAFAAAFEGHSASSLIDIFLFTNVASSFLVTDCVRRFGLGTVIRGASLLMAAGCLLRSGPLSIGLVPYPALVAGTVAVGAAQPFFQCTPPMLSAIWFGKDERATSTAVALNFNQIGIATAFLVGGAMGTNAKGLEDYFSLITLVSCAAAVGTVLQFRDKPPSPPSTSEIEKLIEGEEEPPFIKSVQKFFSTKGFTLPFAAFVCSISITNVVGAFISDVMVRGGITGNFEIDLAGAGFEIAILLGGIVIGGYVDRTKEYKKVTLGCLIATAIALFPLGLNEHMLGKEPLFCVFALFVLGAACGPIQPINAELAVEITYPGDETAVESVQQIGGNLVSALLVPVAEMAANLDWEVFSDIRVLNSDIRGDVIMLMGLTALTYAVYQGFDSPLKRTEADNATDEEEIFEEGVIEIGVDNVPMITNRG